MITDLSELFGSSSEKVLAYLFDRLPVGTAVIDREFRLVRCNPTWAEFIEKHTPSSASNVVPGASLFDLEPGTESVIKPLFAPVFAGETVRQEGVRLESGGIISYWDVVLVPLETNGKVVAVLDVSLDATGRVLDQQALQNSLNALQENEAHLQSMLESAQGYAIYRLAIDTDNPYLGKVLLVSPSIREVTGIEDPYDFNAWFSDIHPDDMARVVAANQRAVEKGVPFDETMRFYDKQRDGWRWVHTVSNPIHDGNGRLTHFNGITIDITEQIQAQEALSQINQMLEQQVAERTQEIEQRHKEMEALYMADEELLQSLDLDAVLQSLIDVTVDVLEADKSSLMVWDESHKRLVVRAAHGFHPETLAQMNFGPGEGSVGWAAATGELVIVDDAQQDERVIQSIIEAEGIRAFMHFPIIVSGKVFGVFNVDYTTPRHFTPAEQRLFTALAQRASLAIENAQLYEQEQRRRQVAENLREVMRTLNSSQSLAEVLDYIIMQASKIMEAEISLLYRIDFERNFMCIEAQHGLPAELQNVTGFPLLNKPIDRLILKRQPAAGEIDHTVERSPFPGSDPAVVKRWHELITYQYHGFLAIPLVVRDAVYGRLTFYYTHKCTFDQEDIEQAMLFGNQVALAIENAQLRDDAEQMAVIGERHRLARELHDAVTQTLFSASLIADVLPRIWERNSEMGQAKLAELRELTRGALAEMRTLLLELRPATLTESRLDELLHQLAAAVIGRSRLQVDVEVEGKRPLPPEMQIALYRITQEALNNIIKHAGATQATINLRFLPDCVTLVVADNGRGFDPNTVSAHSLGLGIMRERAAKINAHLDIKSVIGEGTTISVQVCK